MTFGDSKYDSFRTSKNANPKHKIKITQNYMFK
jgi:hypothetical protein